MAVKWLYFAMLLFLLGILTFCIYYLFSGYDYLVKWYTGLNDCFYGNNVWVSRFFTPLVKTASNKYCIVGICISSSCIAYLLVGMKKGREMVWPAKWSKIKKVDAVAILFLTAITATLWYWGCSLVWPSNDEVFSAVNCAGLPLFQTVSYYMLPNNHIFFNFVNNVCFHGYHDHVFSGRIVSGICYVTVILSAYHWICRFFENRWLAFAAAVTLSLQFPVWGFGTQARGYEMLLLAEWISVFCIFNYFVSQRRAWLQLLAVVGAIAFLIVPSFLYFFGAMVVWGLLQQGASRKADIVFWKYQFICLAIAFLLYLPCLCFSGKTAIAGNQYVAAYQNSKEFLTDFWPMLHNYLDYCFFNFLTSEHQADLLLFISPLCLFFFRTNTVALTLGRLYLALWVAVISVTLKMRIYPFDRALTGQFSVTLFLVIYTLYLCIHSLAVKVRKPWAVAAVLLLLGGLSANFIVKGREHMNHYLCHFQVNDWHSLILEQGVKKIPAGSSVAFSPECFYWQYLCGINGYVVSQCPAGVEMFYVHSNFEATPVWVTSGYEQYRQVNDYTIFKRKKIVN